MKRIGSLSDKGILHAKAGKRKFTLDRYEPSPDLAPFVEHYWKVGWDLRGQPPYRQVILSYPSVQLVFEKEERRVYTGVYGVPSSTYARLLHGEGMALGIKFRPGGFYPFLKQPVSRLTGLSVPCGELFGGDMHPIEQSLFAQDSGERMAALAEAFLRERLPGRDGQAELAARITEAAAEDRSICKVEQLADRFAISVRTLQRLFGRYIGVSPKWVIRRYRLQEAAEKMETGEIPDWAAMSADLGYYDQAHFIKDFKSLIGKPPKAHLRNIGTAEE